MNNTRRGFLTDLIKLGVGCAILPSAVTYGRKWIKTDTIYTMRWEGITPPLYFLPSFQDFLLYDKKKIWPEGMGDTMRKVIT